MFAAAPGAIEGGGDLEADVYDLPGFEFQERGFDAEVGLGAGGLEELVPDLEIFGGLGEFVGVAADAEAHVDADGRIVGGEAGGAGDEGEQGDQLRGDRGNLAGVRDGLGGCSFVDDGEEGHGERVLAIGFEMGKLEIVGGAQAGVRRFGRFDVEHDDAEFLGREGGDDGAVDAAVVEDDCEVFGHVRWSTNLHE